MKIEKIIEFIENPQIISTSDVSFLESILLKHPYFQSGQLLLAKGLQNTNSILFKKHLKKAAAHCLDRKKLFKLINSKNYSSQNKYKRLDDKEQKFSDKKLKINNSLNFDENEQHSFSEWLTVINTKKIKRNTDQKGTNLIDKLLEKEIQISKPKKETFFKAIDVAKESVIENDELITPTLAKVYLEQEHYDKAIEAYKKLILRNPKKSSFFAAQIKLINKLNNK